MPKSLAARLLRDVKVQVTLFRAPVEGVYLLGAGVAKQERRIIRSHTEPNAPIPCLTKMPQIDDGLDFVISDVNSHYRRMIFFVQEINVV